MPAGPPCDQPGRVPVRPPWRRRRPPRRRRPCPGRARPTTRRTRLGAAAPTPGGQRARTAHARVVTRRACRRIRHRQRYRRLPTPGTCRSPNVVIVRGRYNWRDAAMPSPPEEAPHDRTVATARPSLGLLARAIGMITSPRATFENVVGDPTAGRHPVPRVRSSSASPAPLPQFTEPGRQAALDMQVKQIERFRAAGHARAVPGDASSAPVRRLLRRSSACSSSLPIVRCSSRRSTGRSSTRSSAARRRSSRCWPSSPIPRSSRRSARVVGAPIHVCAGRRCMGGPFNLGALVPMLERAASLASCSRQSSASSRSGASIVTAIGLAVLYRRKTDRHLRSR